MQGGVCAMFRLAQKGIYGREGKRVGLQGGEKQPKGNFHPCAKLMCKRLPNLCFTSGVRQDKSSV